MDARSTLRYLTDNCDKELAARGARNLVRDLREAVRKVQQVVEDVAPERAHGGDLVGQSLEQLNRQLRRFGHSAEIPSRPLLGLPLARVIPQDIHSVLDYSDAVSCGAAACMADTVRGRIACTTLAVAVGGISLITGYRLSAVKLVPIEVHEASDSLRGAAIATPFVLGYAKKDPLVTAIQVIAGAMTIVGSLITDCRVARGAGRGWGGQLRQRGQGNSGRAARQGLR